MSYESLINLSKKENNEYLKAVVKYMTQSANRRIKSLLNSPIGEYSPAYKKLKDAGKTKFDVRWLSKATSKETGKLLQQYADVKNFLKAESSTISGWKNIRSRVAKRTGATKLFAKDYKSKRSATYWTNKEKKFWKLYGRLVDEFGGVITELDSTRVQKMLARIQSIRKVSKDEDLIQATMEKYIDELYRAKQMGKKLDDDKFEEEFRIQFRR